MKIVMKFYVNYEYNSEKCYENFKKFKVRLTNTSSEISNKFDENLKK